MNSLERSQIKSDSRRNLKVVQFGGGNFMRAYLDWMVQCANEKTAFSGGVALVKSTAGARYESLERQQGLYHVVTSGIKEGQVIEEIDLITCIDQILYPYEDFAAFIDLAKVKSVKIITSNTTESGIVFKPEDQPSDQPPDSFPGKLCVFLRARYEFFNGDPDRGFLILPCELIADNGKILKEIVLKLAQVWYQEPDFITWIKEANIFANTLVDRIVPGFPSAEHYRKISDRIQLEDQCAVVAEPYHLLVIEGAPELERTLPLKAAGINVIYTDSLSNYRTLKVRLLNGAHIAMVPVGLLMGIATVRECVEHEQTLGFINRLLRQEIADTLTDLPQDQISAYISDVLDRFRNPFIRHELSSIALNAISKFKVRILPSLKVSMEKSTNAPHCMILSFACLIQFYRGDWAGHQLPVQDSPEVVQRFRQIWEAYPNDFEALSRAILGDITLWDEDLTRIPNLVALVAEKLEILSAGKLGLKLLELAHHK